MRQKKNSEKNRVQVNTIENKLANLIQVMQKVMQKK